MHACIYSSTYINLTPVEAVGSCLGFVENNLQLLLLGISLDVPNHLLNSFDVDVNELGPGDWDHHTQL